MRNPWVLTLLAILFTFLFASTGSNSAQQPDAAKQTKLQWFKGNTHTHTLNSDGDSTPDDVVRWYRENGFQFLVLTDHNFLTKVDALNAFHGADKQFNSDYAAEKILGFLFFLCVLCGFA